MGFHANNSDLDRLVADVARITGQKEADAIMSALEAHREKLMTDHHARMEKVWKWLETEVWPTIPEEVRGKPITKEEEAEILGYGPNGYCE